MSREHRPWKQGRYCEQTSAGGVYAHQHFNFEAIWESSQRKG